MIICVDYYRIYAKEDRCGEGGYLAVDVWNGKQLFLLSLTPSKVLSAQTFYSCVNKASL